MGFGVRGGRITGLRKLNIVAKTELASQSRLFRSWTTGDEMHLDLPVVPVM